MKRQRATDRIKQIVDDLLGGGLDKALVAHLAERIYTDVVATAVDDEREDWVRLSFAHHTDEHLH
jgi:uncharacterized protein YtpQ (UPF0354 family)